MLASASLNVTRSFAYQAAARGSSLRERRNSSAHKVTSE